MKRLLLLNLVLFFFVLKSFAQFAIGYGIGYGNYKQTDLQGYQKLVLQNSELPARIVDSFPAYFNHRVELQMTGHNGKEWTLFGAFYSTGGRISLVDYSGSWKNDMHLNAFRLGLNTSIFSRKIQNFGFKLYAEAGISYNDLRINDLLIIGDEQQSSQIGYYAIDVFLQPGLLAEYSFKPFKIGLFAGYEFDTGEDFISYNEKYHIRYSGSNNVAPKWSGYRTGIKLMYMF